MKRRRIASRMASASAAFAALAGAPSAVQAHLVNAGLGPVYDGIGHVLVSPEDLIPVIALAQLAGLRGTAWGRLALCVLPVAWIAGGVIGFRFEVPASPMIPTVSLLLLGGLVAADLSIPCWLMICAAAVVGGLHGVLNGAAVSAAEENPLGLLGMAATVFVLVALLSATVVSLKRPGARIAVRVAGSWIAAIGLLLLGWQIRQSG